MPRLPRIYIKGALYYVTCKGIPRIEIFRDERDYQMFLELLEKYREQYGIRLFSYVLLPGHLHLLLEVGGEKDDISGFMHDLNNSYTKYFNGRYERKGHLFRGRFKAAIVEKAPHLAKLTAYMHLNPQKLNLVGDAKDYAYSSYTDYLNPANPNRFILETEISEVLSFLQNKGYDRLVYELTHLPQDKLHKRLQTGGGIMGSSDFVNMVKQEIENLKSKVLVEESVPKQSRYKFFAITGTSLLVLIVGLGGLYFYYVAPNKTIQTPEPQIIIKEVPREKEGLDATVWNMKLVPLEGGKATNDRLSFHRGKFVSEKLKNLYYSASNYSLIIDEDGTMVWETMQTSPHGTASWRGEMSQGKMQGILSLRQYGEESQDFSFISTSHRRRR